LWPMTRAGSTAEVTTVDADVARRWIDALKAERAEF
jgi:hypothetical protein